MRKKEILARSLSFVLPNALFSNVRHWFKNDLIILAYHRVLSVNKGSVFQYDTGLISATVDEFETQISFIRKYYNPISETQLINHIYHNEPLPPKPVMVTFDDGFDDNYLNAYPILKRYNVPATMFVSTAYIGGNEPIWFDWLASLCISASMKKIEIPVLKKSYIINEYPDRELIYKDLIKVIREINNEVRLKVLDQLKVSYSDYMIHIDRSMSKFMNWNQVIEMSNDNITVGSHTVTHPIMSRLNNTEISYELNTSKEVIESHINKNIMSFSYPTGQATSFTNYILNEVINSGYKVAHTYIHGINKLPINQPHSLNRLHIESHVNESYFKSMLMLPEIFRG